MLDELRRHREMVQGRIQKSFESDGLDLNILKSQEDEIFKSQETEEQETSVTDLIKAGVLEYNDSIEKAVYADTAENRKLGRVGQEYHRGKGKKTEEPNKQKIHKKEDEKVKKRKDSSDKFKSSEEAAKFLSENYEQWSDYQYGDLEDEELEKKFKEVEKRIKTYKQFDYTEHNEAEAYKDKMEKKGYKVVDLGEGSDTYSFAVLKGDKVEQESKNKESISDNEMEKIQKQAVRNGYGEITIKDGDKEINIFAKRIGNYFDPNGAKFSLSISEKGSKGWVEIKKEIGDSLTVDRIKKFIESYKTSK